METFQKTRLRLWRDRLLAVTLLLIAIRFLLTAFQSDGDPIIGLVLQISASLVFLAAGEFSIILFSAPILKLDKLGISEGGFLIGSLNLSMPWTEIAQAQFSKGLRTHIALVSLVSEQTEHVVSGYENFDTIVDRIRNGLRRYGRKVVDESLKPDYQQQ